MTWHASLAIDYALQAGRTVAHASHSGPLRILQSLYPERDSICHNVIVHPPGGLVGGDVLEMRLRVAADAHGLVTTPGATRFYRSDGAAAIQRTQLELAAGARFEWLPLETICHAGCIAENQLMMNLEPGAEMMGWDLTALGLPGAGLPFDRGSFLQKLEVPGVWLERARVRADDAELMQGPLGLAGHSCFATLFFVCGSKLARNRRQLALDAARAVIEAHSLEPTAGATSPDAKVVLVRVLAAHVEDAASLLRAVRTAWRQHLWDLDSPALRIWAM